MHKTGQATVVVCISY